MARMPDELKVIADLKAKLAALTAEDIDHQIDMRLKAEAEVASLRAELEGVRKAIVYQAIELNRLRALLEEAGL